MEEDEKEEKGMRIFSNGIYCFSVVEHSFCRHVKQLAVAFYTQINSTYFLQYSPHRHLQSLLCAMD
jgi:hypothetical protein